MNFPQFITDYKIPVASPDAEHYRRGWLHIRCPCCEDTGTHLGFNTKSGYLYCWRCKGKSPAQVVRSQLGLSWQEAFRIVETYTERPSNRVRIDEPQVQPCREVELPFGCSAMAESHREYLRKRKYNAEQLEAVWNLMGTGYLGDYKFRVIAPITVNGRLVSFQGRDITGQSRMKYKAAALDNEVVHHKHTVYGIDRVPHDTVVVVEGLPSVWRLGPGAVATFGTGWTPAQVGVLKKFRRRYILFDSLKEEEPVPDQDAIRSARELASALAIFGGTTILKFIDYKDPGEMPQDEANQLMKEMMR